MPPPRHEHERTARPGFGQPWVNHGVRYAISKMRPRARPWESGRTSVIVCGVWVECVLAPRENQGGGGYSVLTDDRLQWIHSLKGVWNYDTLLISRDGWQVECGKTNCSHISKKSMVSAKIKHNKQRRDLFKCLLRKHIRQWTLNWYKYCSKFHT